MPVLKIIALIIGYAFEIIIGLVIIALLTVAVMWGWEEFKETKIFERMKGRKK